MFSYGLEDLEKRAQKIKKKLRYIVDDLLNKKIIYKKDSNIRLAGHEISLESREHEVASQMEQTFRKAGFVPVGLLDFKPSMRLLKVLGGFNSHTFPPFTFPLVFAGNSLIL